MEGESTKFNLFTRCQPQPHIQYIKTISGIKYSLGGIRGSTLDRRVITENTVESLYCGLTCYHNECALNVKVQTVQTPGNNLYSADLESVVIRFALKLLYCETLPLKVDGFRYIERLLAHIQRNMNETRETCTYNKL